MWLAPSFPAARAGFDPLSVYIGMFWGFGFIARRPRAAAVCAHALGQTGLDVLLRLNEVPTG